MPRLVAADPKKEDIIDMNKERKFILLFVTILSFIILLPKTVRANGYDTTAPVINSITIDKASIKAPGSFSLTFDITEEGTGVSRIDVTFSDKNGHGDGLNTGISSNENFKDLKEPVYSGSYTMYFSVGSDYPATTIRISQVIIYDQQGNERLYYTHLVENGIAYIADSRDPSESIRFPVNNGNNIDVSFDNGRDTIAPIIKSASMNKTKLKAPGKFSITLDIVEEGTGLSRVFFVFRDKHEENRDKSITELMNRRIEYEQDLPTPLKTGKHRLDFKVSKKFPTDSIQIERILVWDQQGNEREYWNWNGPYGARYENGIEYIEDTDDNTCRCYFYKGNNIDVTTDWKGDLTAPMIKSATVSKSKLKAPGTFSVTLDIVEEGSGLSSIDMFFSEINSNGRYLNDYIVSDQSGEDLKGIKSGKYTMKFRISSECVSTSIFITSISVFDNEGNERIYSAYTEDEFIYDDGKVYLPDRDDNSVRCCVNNKNVFKVIPEFDVAFQSYITKRDNADRLRAMEPGKVAMINYDSKNHKARKKLYDAIRGEDKTIVFSNNEYQWIVNGKNIKKETKDVDLLFSTSKVEKNLFGSDDPAVQVSFADNGTLPGKAQVRMKSDYLYSLGVSGKLYLYHLKGNKLVREKNPKFDLLLDGTDKWCHFDVSHNSAFYVTNTDGASEIPITKEKISSFKVSGITDKKYTGKKIRQDIKLSKRDKETGKKTVLKNGTDYSVTYKNNISVGKATLKIKGKGLYAGTVSKDFKIKKAKNPLSVKGRTANVKLSKLKKKDQTVKASDVIKVTRKGKGKLTYTKKSGNKKITINKKSGKVTVKKGLKAGTYTVEVGIKAAGNSNYKPSTTKNVKFKIIVQK